MNVVLLHVISAKLIVREKRSALAALEWIEASWGQVICSLLSAQGLELYIQ